MSKINNRRKTQKEKKIRKENNNQKVGGQRKEIINKNKATEFYYITVLYLEFQLVRTPPPSPECMELSLLECIGQYQKPS